MTVNKYRPHLLIVPEDDANKDLAVGFLMRFHDLPLSALRIEDVAGGWTSARERLVLLCRTLRNLQHRRVLVLVDFDESDTRREDVLQVVPDDLKERVFVLGVWSEPEELQRALSHTSRERIGALLAQDCEGGTRQTWEHRLLVHNADEVARLCTLLEQLRD